MSILKNIYNNNYFDNKSILITGGSGTIGNQLIEYFLSQTNCLKICIFSRDEFKQHQIKIKLQYHNNYNKLRFFLGDIRDAKRIKYSTQNINIVIHAAALKQIDAIEYNPIEAIKTNIIGTQNVIDACIANNVQQLIGISTDKSVSPVNLYGATKLCLEKLILSAYAYSGEKLKSCVLRYGNVVGSRGSIIPILLEQNKNNLEFTITDLQMTRFTITKDEALKFIINCITLSEGGEIFVPKLPKYTLKQLCEHINKDNRIKIIGLRPGEKMHEEMISYTESDQVYYTDDHYIIVSNMIEHFNNTRNYIKNTERFIYSSNNADLITNNELAIQIN